MNSERNPKISYSNLYTSSQQELMKNARILEELDRLGIEIYFDNINYNTDELKAIDYIISNKKVPIELEKRLLSTKEERTKEYKAIPIKVPTEDEIESMLGIKLPKI